MLTDGTSPLSCLAIVREATALLMDGACLLVPGEAHASTSVHRLFLEQASVTLSL